MTISPPRLALSVRESARTTGPVPQLQRQRYFGGMNLKRESGFPFQGSRAAFSILKNISGMRPVPSQLTMPLGKRVGVRVVNRRSSRLSGASITR
jgi:hypothetical protein